MENQELNFYEKLNKMQTLLKAPKEKKNTFGNFKYRSIEDILESIKPLLETYKLVLLISDEVVSIGERIYIKATAKIINTTDDKCLESIGYAREATHKKGMDESQITGAASTYARKSSLSALFCLDNSHDADATNDHKENNVIDSYNELSNMVLNCDTVECLTSWSKNNTDKLSYLKKVSSEDANKLRNMYSSRLKELRGELDE